MGIDSEHVQHCGSVWLWVHLSVPPDSDVSPWPWSWDPSPWPWYAKALALWPVSLGPKSLLTSLPPDGPITFKLRPKCSTVAFLLPNYIFAARCYPRETLAVMQCLSACPSITSVHAVKMNKHIFRIYSPLGSQATLVFQYQTAWQYSNRNPSNGGVKRRWGRQKSRFWANIWLHCTVQHCDRPAVINMMPQDQGPASCDTYRW